MNLHHLVRSWMRVLLAVTLLLAFVSVEQSVAPSVALAAATVSISAGNGHTCLVKSDGTVTCWGNNAYGQATPPAGTFSQISAGWEHTCGLKTDGTLACWGNNQSGQATPPAGAFSQVSAGDFYTCGLKTNGALACWGDNLSGQATPPAGTFSQVDAGYQHTCAVKSDSTLACWGDNSLGQAAPPAGTFSQIRAGNGHSCGLKTNGTLACWGSNTYGQATPPAGTFSQISAGYQHTCGIKTDGTLACWGSNTYGQATPPAGSYTQVSAGVSHTCAVGSDGTVVCWGNNTYGQAPRVTISPAELAAIDRGAVPPALSAAGGSGGTYTFTIISGTLPPGLSLQSNGTWTRSNPAGGGHYAFIVKAVDNAAFLSGVQRYTLDVTNTSTVLTDDTPDPSTVGQSVLSYYTVTPLTAGVPSGNVTVSVVQQALRFLQIDAGYRHTCGVKSDGTLACWGTTVAAQTPNGSFSQISAGLTYFTCAVKSDHTLACWGDNTWGQSSPPVGTFTQVASGYDYACGLKTDGTLICWGRNDDGQATPPIGTFTQIDAGYQSSCALKTDRTLACWGDSTYEQTTPPEGTFTQVSISGGHACGVKTDGTVACWGNNLYGQATPPEDTFIQVSAGSSHTCGLKTDGAVTCWGRDNVGQATPPEGTFIQVSAGDFHTCAIQSDNTPICWGNNNEEQSTPPPPATISNSTETCTASVGAGQCAIPFTSVGLKSIQASYAGDSTFTASASALLPHAVKAATTTAITSITPNPAVMGQAVEVHYTVTSAVQGIPMGRVTVQAGADSCTGMATAGVCYLTFTSAGAKSLTATYAGDGAFSSSVSAAATGSVINKETVTQITNDTPDPSTVGQSVPLHYTVTGFTAGAPTGNVTLAVVQEARRLRQASAGYTHTCGVKSDSTVACWGLNDGGQATPPVGTFSQVSAGYQHTCGVKSDGTVACWGDSTSGQAMPPGGSFRQVSAGYAHTCGVKSDSTVACWGDNTNGEATPPAGTFSQVSVGYTHTCGVKSDGTLACWGLNDDGQATPPGGSFRQVSAGYQHSCGVKSDGTLACWGLNDDGQATPPVGTFSQVSAGYAHTCGVKSDGTLACWGDNTDGQATPPVGTFSQVSAGYQHSCGVKSDSTLACWGDNTDGQATSTTTSSGAETCTASVSAGGCAITFASVGLKYLRASYTGDGTFHRSTSELIAHNVKATTTTTITSINPTDGWRTMLVHYTIASAVQDIPLGSVRVQAGADSCTALATDGVCRLTLTSAGTKSITATYAGDSAFYESSSPAMAYTVNDGVGTGQTAIFLPLVVR